MPHAPTTQRKQLTDLQKGAILSLKEEKLSQRSIAEKLKIPRDTIKNFLKRFRMRGTPENLPRPGRPHLTTPHKDQELHDTVIAQPHIKYKALRELLNLNISIRTIRRRLREEHIRKWRARGCTKITQRVADARLKWAMKYKDLTSEDWSYVVFTDEVSVEKGDDITDIWVFRQLGERDKCLPQHVKTHIRITASLMLWGCFAGCLKGPLVPIYGHQTAETYIQLLQEHLIPFIMGILPKNGIFDAIFQQDNAPIHKAHITMEFLHQQGFVVMDFPPNSPDMNPIEHLWNALKRELFCHFPDTADLPGCPETVRHALAERLAMVWAEIGEDIMNALIDSMPRRIQALIEAKGWYTKY